MSEFSSNPEAFDPSEQLALLDLIEVVQEKVKHALEYEEKLRQLSVTEGQAGGRSTNIARHDIYGNEHVVGGHTMVVWVPEHGEEPLFGIRRMEVRTPDISEHDFFLRLYDTQDNEQNFLLNNKGIKPFNFASTDIDETFLIELGDTHYRVKEEVTCEPAVMIDVMSLDAIFNDSYKYWEQPRQDPNQPPFGQAS